MAKVIGTTGTNVLVEMSQDEIARLMGHSSLWSLKYDAEKRGKKRPSNDDVFKVGMVIPLGDVWSRVDKVCNSEATFRGLAAEMRKTAEWLDTIPAIIDPPDPKKAAKKETEDA